jgi:transcriptional regulator with XRE-family HTH domain
LVTLPQLRLRHFLTQKALADQIGVHPRLVSSWEQGRYRPSMEHLRRICEVFEIGPEELEWPEKDPALKGQGEARCRCGVAAPQRHLHSNNDKRNRKY